MDRWTFVLCLRLVLSHIFYREDLPSLTSAHSIARTDTVTKRSEDILVPRASLTILVLRTSPQSLVLQILPTYNNPTRLIATTFTKTCMNLKNHLAIVKKFWQSLSRSKHCLIYKNGNLISFV